MEKRERAVKGIFIIRIILWIIALCATIYWIYWSFKLYTMGIYNEYEYAAHLRPIFAKGIFVSVSAVIISFILRSVSDKIKAHSGI